MKHTTLVVLACLMALAGTAAADETTFCNAFITSLPFTISTQGHYCFNKNLSTTITSGNAITVNADFVVIDLNNFKLGGGAAGFGTLTNGIFALDRQNITIRNGNIRGFMRGIWLEDNGRSGGHLIENNVLDTNTVYGALVESGNTGNLPNVIRNNTVTNTGGSTAIGYDYAYGIDANGSHPALVEHNFVTSVYNISTYNRGIDNDGMAIGNTVYMDYDNTDAMHVDGICRDNNIMASQYAFTHSCGFFENATYGVAYYYFGATRPANGRRANKSETRAPRH